MKYWILDDDITNENQAYIQLPPKVMAENDWEFDNGEVFIHKIPKIHYKLEDEVGVMQDCLSAPGLSGLVINGRLKEHFDKLELENIQVFPVDIELITGEIYEYFILNIVGKYDIVDYEKSDVQISETMGFVRNYRSLSFIDTSDLILPEVFRWSEMLPVIIASDKVKLAIGAGGFTGIRFIEPEKHGMLKTIL